MAIVEVRKVFKTNLRGLLGILLACLSLTIATSSLRVCAGEQGGGGAPVKKEPTVAEKITGAQNPQKDSEEREELIKGLGGVSPEQERDNKVVEGLLDIATKVDDDPSVRVAAILTLGTLETNVTRDHKSKNKTIQPFAAILKNAPGNGVGGESAPVRRAVVKVWRQTLSADGLQDKDVGFRALVDIARNKNEQNQGLRNECILAIGDFGDLEGLQIIVDILNEQDSYVREKAASALSVLIQKVATAADKVGIATIRKLIELLADQKTSDDLKINVMDALAQLIQNGNGSAAREGLQPIKDIVAKSEQIKLVIGGIHALGVIGTIDALEPLKKAYKDCLDLKQPSKNTDVRIAVVRATRNVLTTQKKAKAMDMKAASDGAALLVTVTDEDPAMEVKASAVYAMRTLEGKKFDAQKKEAIESLFYLLKDKKTPEDLKKKIPETLEYITGMDFEQDIPKWGKWLDEKYGGGKHHNDAPADAPKAPEPPKDAPKAAPDAPKGK